MPNQSNQKENTMPKSQSNQKENTMEMETLNIKDKTIIFNWNKVIPQADMVANTCYLDGAVQGPVLDNSRFSYSFDHHSDCVRNWTSATCKQVRDSLELGFPIHKINTIVINDIDADTVLATWLLLNPTRCNEEAVVKMVEEVAWVDSNFFATRSLHPLHATINGKHWLPENNTVDSLKEKLEKIDKYLSGEFVPTSFNRPPVRVIGISVASKSVIHDDVAELIDVYRGGADVVIGCVPAPNGDGTWGYIIGKTSDFVPCFLKEQSEKIPTKGVFFSCQEKEPKGRSEKVWNGSSSVGGAVFYEDGSRSSLSPEQVLEIVLAHIS